LTIRIYLIYLHKRTILVNKVNTVYFVKNPVFLMQQGKVRRYQKRFWQRDDLSSA